jgi:hypothetical protein
LGAARTRFAGAEDIARVRSSSGRQWATGNRCPDEQGGQSSHDRATRCGPRQRSGELIESVSVHFCAFLRRLGNSGDHVRARQSRLSQGHGRIMLPNDCAPISEPVVDPARSHSIQLPSPSTGPQPRVPLGHEQYEPSQYPESWVSTPHRLVLPQ